MALPATLAPWGETLRAAENEQARTHASETKAGEIAPVVVVASRMPESLAELSPSVSYVDAVQLADAGNYSLADVLRVQAGFQTLGDATGNTGSVFTRGLESRMTLFTLDGRRLNPGFSNFDVNTLGTDNLASIQIMRGATSTIHGADAAAGVIDLRTVDPLALDKPSGLISAEGGSNGYMRSSLNYAANDEIKHNGKSLGKLGASVGTSWTESDGWRPNSDYRAISLLPRLDYRPNDKVLINFIARYNSYESGMPGDTSTPSATDRFRSENLLLSPGVTLSPSENLELAFHYSYTQNDYKVDDSWGGDHNIADGHEAALQARWRINDTLLLNGGYTYEKRIYDRAGQHYHGRYDSNTPWLQLQATPLKGLLLSIAGRYNQFSDYKDAVTGEANISYRIEHTRTTLHARAANAYNVPDIGTLSYDTTYGYGTPSFFPSHNLEPEKNLAWEIGIKQEIPLLEGLTLGAVLFQNRVTDLIQWDWATRTGYNVNKARTQGIELNADLRLNTHFRLYGNATVLNAENRQTRDRLVRRPDFSVTLGIEHTPTTALTAGLSVTYIHGIEDNLFTASTSRRVDLRNYAYARLYASYRLAHGMEIFGRIENLFDTQYSVVAGYPAPPISAYAGLRYRF